MDKEIITEDGNRVPMDDTTYASYYSPLARLVWTVLGIINGLLAIRFLLHLFGANPAAGFTSFIYSITAPLVAPFVNVIRTTTVGIGTIQWTTLLAMAIYWLVAWALVRLATLNKPAMRY